MIILKYTLNGLCTNKQFNFAILIVIIKPLFRFGSCQPYIGNSTLCNNVFSKNTDYVFISSIHGSQQNISNFLDKQISSLQLYSRVDSHFCYENLIQVLCKYYMSPCGTEFFQHLPTSICPKDCKTVMKDCPTLWELSTRVFRDYKFIECSDTTGYIIPLPNCCTSIDLPFENKGQCL